MGRLSAPPTNGAVSPSGPTQGDHDQVWPRDGWFTCLGGEIKTHQKNRGEMVPRPKVAAI
jgi:hypothetical protein